MHFASGINRPPYETADGYLQTTEGCSHNTCLFCTYFKDQKFRKSTIEETEADIKEIPKYFGAPKRRRQLRSTPISIPPWSTPPCSPWCRAHPCTEHKKAHHEKQFPVDLEKARQMGAELVRLKADQ